MRLSATIITLNEERNIDRCLSSIEDLVDEIVVLDSGSTDETIKKAEKYGARVYKRKFDNYASQKNFAFKKAKGEWILSLDADEVITPELKEEIKRAIKSEHYSAYSIPRRNIILGRFIKYSRWQPELDRHIWLFKKSSGKWAGEVHEEFEVKGKVGKLKNAKIHYQYKTVYEFLDMMNRYSEFDAKKRIKNGVKFSFFRFLFDPTYNFLVRYFYRLGFLDGWRGYVLSCLMAIYHLKVWSKIWEKQNVKISLI